MEFKVPKSAWATHVKNHKSAPRHACTAPMLKWGDFPLPVRQDVPEEVCLPLPEAYQVPLKGAAGEAVKHASIALIKGRSLFIHGAPGSGKDAIVHAYSAMTRTPGLIFTICPNTDISSWLYTRAFDATSTYWEEGSLLKALRDGYTTESGEVVPYIILLSDFDRADRAQAETLRLILDSIKGRVMGPDGKSIPVLPGTRIVATANSSGGGDMSGRMSSNMIDASIMDRFQCKVQFVWLTVPEELEILAVKFPRLFRLLPSVRKQLADTLTAIRAAIHSGELDCDFSARALSSWCLHMEDIIDLEYGGTNAEDRIPSKAFRVVSDGMPDDQTRLAIRRIADPHLKGFKV